MSDEAAPGNEVGPSVPAGAISRELLIINKRGLHARASAKFVQMVERFNAEVWVTRGNETVGGTSIMGLMMLAAGPGTNVVVSAIGPEAQAAIDAIAGWLRTSSTKKAREPFDGRASIAKLSKRIGDDAAVDAQRGAVGGAGGFRADVADQVGDLLGLRRSAAAATPAGAR